MEHEKALEVDVKNTEPNSLRAKGGEALLLMEIVCDYC